MKYRSTLEEQNFIKLGNMINKARLDNKMSLRDLCVISGVNYKTIHKIETAGMKKIDPITLARLSNVLKTDFTKMMVLAGYFEVVFKLKYENNTEKLK